MNLCLYTKQKSIALTLIIRPTTLRPTDPWIHQIPRAVGHNRGVSERKCTQLIDGSLLELNSLRIRDDTGNLGRRKVWTSSQSR